MRGRKTIVRSESFFRRERGEFCFRLGELEQSLPGITEFIQTVMSRKYPVPTTLTEKIYLTPIGYDRVTRAWDGELGERFREGKRRVVAQDGGELAEEHRQRTSTNFKKVDLRRLGGREHLSTSDFLGLGFSRIAFGSYQAEHNVPLVYFQVNGTQKAGYRVRDVRPFLEEWNQGKYRAN